MPVSPSRPLGIVYLDETGAPMPSPEGIASPVAAPASPPVGSDAPSLFEAIQEIGGAAMAQRRGQPASSGVPERSPWEGWLEGDVSENVTDPWVDLTGEINPEIAREMAEAGRVWQTIHRPREEAPSSPAASKGPWGESVRLVGSPMG